MLYINLRETAFMEIQNPFNQMATKKTTKAAKGDKPKRGKPGQVGTKKKEISHEEQIDNDMTLAKRDVELQAWERGDSVACEKDESEISD